MNHVLKKGDRVRARWMAVKTDPPAALAGMQLKFEGRYKEVCGVVTHIRGDHPTEPVEVAVWIQPDEGPEVGGVPIDSIIEILDPAHGVA